jgi:TolA-binding protein
MVRIGECYYSLESWAEGLKTFGQAAEKYPQGKYVHDSYCGVGRCAQRMGAFKDAVAGYRKAIADYNGEAAARAQFGLGECAFLQQDYKGALAEFLIVDFKYAYPQWSAAALVMAGRCHAKLDNPEKAKAYFQQVASDARFKDTPHVAEAKAELQKLEGKP